MLVKVATGLYALSRPSPPASHITTMTSENTILTLPCPMRHLTDFATHICMRTMIICYFLDGKGGGHPAVFIATGGSIPGNDNMLYMAFTHSISQMPSNVSYHC